MFTKHANQEVGSVIIFHWLLMSACAGIMNAVAFIGLGTFATHVTGFGTLFGVHLANGQIGNAMAALAVPLFFLLGSIISGMCVEARVRQNKMPHYDYVMFACCALLIASCFIGNHQGLDKGQTYLRIKSNFLLLSLICLSSGLMNAALSYSSHTTIRITHLTGVTTDLGRGIAEWISLRIRNVHNSNKELRLNLLRVMTIFSFMTGGLIGAVLFGKISFYVLLIPAVYLGYAGNRGRRSKISFKLGQNVSDNLSDQKL
jgi:uncharacterized membrane protein YoaK (UPF0700 family)